MAGHFDGAAELSVQTELGLSLGNLGGGLFGDMSVGGDTELVHGRDCTVTSAVAGGLAMIPLTYEGLEVEVVEKGLDLDNWGENRPLGSHF